MGAIEEVKPIYVYAVGYTRHYGGPEEGGWWYDNSELLKVLRCWTPQQIEEAKERLKDEFPTCRRGRGSVLGGMDVEIYDTTNLAEIPEDNVERPRYE